MIFLIAALSFSLCIMVTFKLFPRFHIHINQAITTNYLTAAILGFISLNAIPTQAFFIQNEWKYVSLISGIFLILVFYVFALSTKKAGVAITAVSSKMSVIIPVFLGVIIFGEVVSSIKIIGVVLVLCSFYLVFRKKEGYKIKLSLLFLPLLLFLGNGTNDSVLKYAQYNYITNNFGYIHYLTVAFSISFVLGLSYLCIRLLLKKEVFNAKSILAGIWLGTCNWFSTLFFLKGLGTMDVSVFIPIFNAGLVSSAAFIGLLVFKESLSKINILGIILSIIAISIIAYV
jgi:drug/metabolite transporter (DMT)-like permease